MPNLESRPDYQIADLLGLIRRQKWTIIISIVVIVAGVVGYELQKPKLYESTVALLLSQQYTVSANGVQPQGPSFIDFPTDIALVNSAPVQQAVRKALGTVPGATARQASQSDILDITVETTSPEFAAKAANEYAAAFNSVSKARAAAAVDPVIAQLQGSVNSLNRQQAAVQQAEANYEATHPNDSNPSVIFNYDNQIQTLAAQVNTTETQLRTEQLLASLNTGGGQVVNAATPNHTPVSPQPVRDGGLALLGGIVIGIGLSMVREYFDDHLRTKEDIEKVVAPIPALGVVPTVDDWSDRAAAYLVSADRPHSPTAEAYRSLRTAIHFMALGNPIRTLQVTSAASNDGKTATTANLAMAMAMAGQRVVAVSCDLRRPRLHEFFKVPNNVGLTSVLIGEAQLSDVAVPAPGIANLWVVPSGPIPPNPSELLSSQRLVDIFERIAQEVDIVLVDSPPVLPVTDAAVLAAAVDAVLIVAASGNSTKKSLARALELLARVDAPIIGAILNSASKIDSYGYQAGYGYEEYSVARAAAAATAASSANGNGQKAAAPAAPPPPVARYPGA